MVTTHARHAAEQRPVVAGARSQPGIRRLAALTAAAVGAALLVTLPVQTATAASQLIRESFTGTVAASELVVTLGGTAVAGTSDGLQLALDRCSVAWTGDPGTAVCPGTITPVAADRPAVGRIALPGSPALAVGGRDRLRITVRLASSAPSTAQAVTGSVTLRVDGVQRPGTQR